MNISFDFNKYKFPNDWTKIKLKECLVLEERPIVMDDDIGYRLVTVKRNFGGIQERSVQKGKEILVKSQFVINEKDFVISKRQIAHGACGIVPKELDNSIVSNEYNVFTTKENLNLNFFNYYVQLPFVKRYFYISSDGVHIEKLLFKTKDWLNRYIVIPSISEQNKIVKIIKDWDLAIEKQEQLIEKKKEFKKGLMQRLLSGEVRFKEFTDEWRKLKLGDILYEPVKEKVVNPSEYELITVKLHCNGVEKTGKFPNITENGRPYYFRNPGELLIGRQNFHNGGIAIVPEGIKNNICSNAISSFCAKDSINIDFVYYYLSRRDYYKKVEFLIGGTGQKEISKKEFNNLKISIPNYLEQCKIVDFLKTVDNEIELLKKELEALKLQKKGLMQRLLTGEVRVKV